MRIFKIKKFNSIVYVEAYDMKQARKEAQWAIKGAKRNGIKVIFDEGLIIDAITKKQERESREIVAKYFDSVPQLREYQKQAIAEIEQLKEPIGYYLPVGLGKFEISRKGLLAAIKQDKANNRSYLNN